MPGFEAKELSWPLDDTTMSGTLVAPDGSGPFPALIMVAGSGPTDRDWNSPLIPGSNGSARLLAEALAGDGFASLRYDKRASGPHVRENMQALMGKVSFQSHLDELTSAVQILAADPRIDRARIFALTNSEGALHALNYQVHDPAIPFAGLVLTGAPGRSIGEVARMQMAGMFSALPDGPALLQAYDAAVSRFVAGQPIVPDPALPQPAQMLLMALETPANLPFARELWMTDAADWLPQVQAPVLIVIGKKDIQVSWQIDGGELERAATGHDNVTIRYPENANHVLKHEPRALSEIPPTDVVASYNAADSRLDPETFEIIRDWLKRNAKL